MSVIELSKNDFSYMNIQRLVNSRSDFTVNKGITIVKFYSPNCIYCIKTQPAYEELAKEMKNNTTELINVAQFNCNDNSEIMDNSSKILFGFQVEGYPTFAIYVDGLFFELYNGDRDTNSMKSFLLMVASKLK